LGRTDDAIREFERLLEDHGDVDIAPIRLAYLLLGELYERQNRREDAVAIWRRGLERFPDATQLAEKLRAAGAIGGPAGSGGPTAPGTPGTPGTPTGKPVTGQPPTGPGNSVSEAVYHLEPIVVEGGGFSVDDPRT